MFVSLSALISSAKSDPAHSTEDPETKLVFIKKCKQSRLSELPANLVPGDSTKVESSKKVKGKIKSLVKYMHVFIYLLF